MLLSTVDSSLVDSKGNFGTVQNQACQPRCTLVSVTQFPPFCTFPQIPIRYPDSVVSLAPPNDSSMNYDTHTYLTVLLTHSSSILADPSRVHPELKHVGPVRYDILPNLIRSGPHAMPKGRSTA